MNGPLPPGGAPWPGYPPYLPAYPAMHPLGPEQRPVKTPRVVWASMWCWIGGMALAVLALLVPLLAHWSEFFDSVRADNGSDAGARFAGDFTVAVMVLMILVAGTPFLVLSLFMRAGRNGARIALYVLGGLAVLLVGLLICAGLFGGSSLTGTKADFSVIFPALTLWTDAVAAIILMSVPSANHYFRVIGGRW